MPEKEEDEFAAFLKTQGSSISTSKDIDEKLSNEDSEEDEFAQFLKKTEAQQPKKEAATPIAEKEIEEPVVAENPIQGEGQEPSSQSVLPSQGSGLDSQSSADEPQGLNLFDAQKANDNFQAEEKTDLERSQDLAAANLSVATRLDEINKEEFEIAQQSIKDTFEAVQDDENATDEEIETARLAAKKQSEELLVQQQKGKEASLGRLLKGYMTSIKDGVESISGDNSNKEYTTFINKQKKEIAKKDYGITKETRKLYDLNERISDETSYDAVRGGLADAVVPHNAYLKIANIKNQPVNSDVSFTDMSKNKEEGLAAYKQELLDQIAKDNKDLGGNLTETELKRYALKEVEEVAAIANSLAQRRDKVNGIKAEKQELLAEDHKRINGEIEDLKSRLIDEAKTLNPDEKKYINDLIIKNENLKESFFEEDGAKAAELVNGDIKEGTIVYSAYKDIIENLPKDISSKEKFDMFYIALEKATNKALGDAGLLDDNGVYQPTIENAFRDWLGIESVLGVDFSGSMLGSLTTEEVDAMQLKGKLDDLTNIFLNNTAYSNDNYWDEFISSMAEGLMPNMSRAGGDRQSDAKKASETAGTIADFGIAQGEGVNKEHLQAFSDLVATPEKGVNFEKVFSTAGSSAAVMYQLYTGTGILKAAKVGKQVKVLLKIEKALNKTKAGKLAVASFKSGADVLKATKAGKIATKAGKLTSDAVKSGVNAEFTGRLFNDREELAFEQFAVSEVGSQVAEKLLKRGGGLLAGVLIKKMGVNSKAALDFTGKLVSNSFGELTDETIQTGVSAYKKSNTLKGTVEELHKQFPDMDSVTEFAVLTSIMGATFKLPISSAQVMTRLKEGGYDTSKAEDIMTELAKEYKKAADIVSEEGGKEGVDGEEGHLTKVTDKKSPVKGGDTFTLVKPGADGVEMMEESYKINKIDKDFNVHVTVNGKEKVLSKEEFSELRKNQSFELFRESKAPVKAEAETEAEVAEETVAEPVAEVVKEAPVESVTPAEVIIDESGESEYTNKEGLFFKDTEVAKMTPEQLSNMIIKNPSVEVQANLDKAAGVAVEATEEVVEEAPVEVIQEVEADTVEVVPETETKSEDKTETVQAEKVVAEPVVEKPAGETTKATGASFVSQVDAEGKPNPSETNKIDDAGYEIGDMRNVLPDYSAGENGSTGAQEVKKKKKGLKSMVALAVKIAEKSGARSTGAGIVVQFNTKKELAKEQIAKAELAFQDALVKHLGSDKSSWNAVDFRAKKDAIIKDVVGKINPTKDTTVKAETTTESKTAGETTKAKKADIEKRRQGELKSLEVKVEPKEKAVEAKYSESSTVSSPMSDKKLNAEEEGDYGTVRTNDGKSGILELNLKGKDFELAINSPNSHLETAFDYNNPYSSSATGIEVIKHPVVELTTDKDGNKDWDIVEKGRINFTNNTSGVTINIESTEGGSSEATKATADKAIAEVNSKYDKLNDEADAEEAALNSAKEKAKSVAKAEVVKETTTKPAVETKEDVKTKTEPETKKQTKAEAKAAKKLEADKKAESRKNSLARKVSSYNSLSDTKKGQTKGRALLATIQRMSGEQGNTISQDGKKIKVTNSEGKSVRVTNKFGPKEVIAEVSSQDKAWAINEINDGRLDSKDGRVQLPGALSTGLTTDQITKGVEKIKEKKYDAIDARRVLASMAEVRKSGNYEVSDISGGLRSVPIDQVSDREITEEEVLSKEEIDADSSAKADEQTKAQKILDATDAFVEKIKKKKYKPPGSFMSTVGAIELYNGAIDLIAATVKAGGTATAAVAKAIAHIKASDWYKKKLPADRKQMMADVEADLTEKAKEIEVEAKKENAAEESKDKQEKEEKTEKGKTKAEKLREELSQVDPARRDKISKHFQTILDNPTISKATKDAFQEYSDGKYETTTNEKDIQIAIDAVRLFDQEGMLDELIDDVAANFTSWGPVGNFILEASMLHYGSLGASADAAVVAEKKLRLISKTGAILQSAGISLTNDQIASLMKTAMTITSQAKKDVIADRDTELDKKTDKKDLNSKTQKEQILEGITDLEEAIKEIAAIATKDPKIKKAIEKAFGKGKPESKPKTKSEKNKADLKKEVKKRAKIIADAKKNMGKNFYSSLGVTPEGIEMIGDLAASYVRSGITSIKILADKLRTILKDEFDVEISDTDLEKVMTYTGKDGQTAKDLIELQKDMVSEVLKKKILKSLDGKQTKSTKKAIDLIAESLFGKFKDTAPKSGTPVSKVDQRKKMIDLMLEKDFSAEQWEKAKTSIKEKLQGDLDSGSITQAEHDNTMNKLDSFFGDKVKLPFSEKLVDKVIREDLKKNKKSISALVQEIYDGISSGKDVIGGISSDILKDSGLSDSEISELTEVIEERLQNMVSVSLSKKIALEKKREQAKEAKEIENAPENKLAKRILKQLEGKEKAKTADAVEVMIRNLFSKAKETLPERAKKETDTSYRKKLIEGMEGQEFSKQVWENSKITVENILEGKESTGEITGAEKAQILKDLDSYFESKVGAPFSKKLVGDSIKEQLKSNEETIQDIVNEHYSNREARGVSLQQKIMENTEGLSDKEVEELTKVIQDQFGEMVKTAAEKALSKSLGIDPEGNVKAKDDATLEEIVKAIKQGALDEGAYLDAFAKRFGFPTMTKADGMRLDKFVLDIMSLDPTSGAAAKEIRDFNTYLDRLKMNNAPLAKKMAHYLSDVFITNILGTVRTALRGALGIFFTGPISHLTETFKVSMWLALTNPKLLKGQFENFHKDINKKTGEVQKTKAIMYLLNHAYKDKKADKMGSMRDIFKESFTSYEAGQENIFGSAGRKGILNELVDDKSFSDITGGPVSRRVKKVVKAYSWLPVTLTKALAASDILHDAATRPSLATTYAIKKALIDKENLPKTAKEFWQKIAKMTSSDAESQEKAEKQAQEELALLKEKGGNTKNFDVKRRVKEILWRSMDEDVRAAAERKASEGRLGHNPEGDIGMFSNWLNERSKGSKLANFAINVLTVPFRKIPSNAINLAIDYTPVGYLRAIFGRGWISQLAKTKKRDKARERARIGGGFLESVKSKYERNKGKKKNDREYTGEMLMSDRSDMLIRATIGTTVTAGLAALLLNSLGDDDDEGVVGIQIMAAGKNNYSDNEVLEKGDKDGNRIGIKPYHVRIKAFGVWSPWMDYSDSTFAIGLTMLGKLSDDMMYGKGGKPSEMNDTEKWDAIDAELASAAALEGMLAFKQKSYIQAINDLASLTDFDDVSGFEGVTAKTFKWLTRPVKGTIYPQVYNNTFKTARAVFGQDKKSKAKIKESIIRNFIDNVAINTPAEYFLNDYVNSAGEKVQMPMSVMPFASVIPGLKSESPLTASQQLMQDREKLNTSEVFKSPLRGRKIEDENGELGYDDYKAYESQYLERIELFVAEKFAKLSKASDDDFVELMEEGRSSAHESVLKDNPEWTRVE